MLEKPKVQSKMEIPETVETFVTQDTGRRQTKHNTTHKTKKISNTDETKTGAKTSARE